MKFNSYNFFNKWFVPFSSNNAVKEIENNATVNVKIKIMRDMIDMFEKNYQQKQAKLNDINVELNNSFQEIWTRRNVFCCQVWNFSHDHNFLDIIEHYPYIINRIKIHNCQYSSSIGRSIKDEYVYRTGTQNNEHIQNLEKEIITLKKELNTTSISKNTEIIIQNFSIKLGYLKLLSEEIVKLLKIIHTNEKSLDDQKFNKNSEVLESKNNNLLINANINNMLTFTKARILIGQYNSNSHVLSEENNVIPRMIMENTSKTEYYIVDTKEQFKNKFSVKTQSNISLKFEQTRCLKKQEK